MISPSDLDLFKKQNAAPPLTVIPAQAASTPHTSLRAWSAIQRGDGVGLYGPSCRGMAASVLSVGVVLSCYHPLLPCQALGQALVLSHQGRGDMRLVLACFTHTPPLWIADQVRNDVTMRCIVFTLCSQCQVLGQALIPLRSRERGFCRLVWLVGRLTPPCGYCLEASMTAARRRPVDSRLRGNDGHPPLPLWIADQVRNDVSMRCIYSSLSSIVSTLFRSARMASWLARNVS